MSLLEQLKVEVYIAHEKYFLPDHRGLYHTKFNAMFLNKTFMEDHWSFLRTLRHEAFHVAQDCMAGSLNNSAVAIINLPEEVPLIVKEITANMYKSTPYAIPWEQEAVWASGRYNMSAKALQACVDGPMWDIYPPTPLTKKYLIEKGYITE